MHRMVKDAYTVTHELVALRASTYLVTPMCGIVLIKSRWCFFGKSPVSGSDNMFGRQDTNGNCAWIHRPTNTMAVGPVAMTCWWQKPMYEAELWNRYWSRRAMWYWTCSGCRLLILRDLHSTSDTMYGLVFQGWHLNNTLGEMRSMLHVDFPSEAHHIPDLRYSWPSGVWFINQCRLSEVNISTMLPHVILNGGDPAYSPGQWLRARWMYILRDTSKACSFMLLG